MITTMLGQSDIAIRRFSPAQAAVHKDDTRYLACHGMVHWASPTAKITCCTFSVRDYHDILYTVYSKYREVQYFDLRTHEDTTRRAAPKVHNHTVRVWYHLENIM